MGCIREKIGKGMSERERDDMLGRENVGADSAKPGTEGLPDGAGVSDAEIEEDALSDNSGLNEGMEGGSLAKDGSSVRQGFSMEELIAGATA